MGRTGDDHPADHPAVWRSDPTVALHQREKLVHRALGGTPCAPRPGLSADARARLYARMFPEEFCLGSRGDGQPDPIS